MQEEDTQLPNQWREGKRIGENWSPEAPGSKPTLPHPMVGILRGSRIQIQNWQEKQLLLGLQDTPQPAGSPFILNPRGSPQTSPLRSNRTSPAPRKSWASTKTGHGGPYTPGWGQGQLPACSSGASVRKGTRRRVIPAGLPCLSVLLVPQPLNPQPSMLPHSAPPGAEKRHKQKRGVSEWLSLCWTRINWEWAGPLRDLPGDRPAYWDPLQVTFGGSCSPQVVDGSQNEPAGLLFIGGDAQHLHGRLQLTKLLSCLLLFLRLWR